MIPLTWSQDQPGSFSQVNISEFMGRLITAGQTHIALGSYRLECAEIKERTNQNACKKRRRSNRKILSDKRCQKRERRLRRC